jgi:SAM-dependent methyltransferase
MTYCELGCGQGFTTNLLAAANPHIEFYANDFNPSHIVGARELAAEAGIQNVHFFEQSFAEFLNEPALPDFDIIALHGIFSWISVENRATIVEFIRRKLKPGGLTYISYNTLPGQAASAPLRHLIYLTAKDRGHSSAVGISQALSLIDRILATNPVYLRMNPAVKKRIEAFKEEDQRYLVHEYLNENWTSLYYSDVAEILKGAKLDYVGPATLLDYVDAINIFPEQQQVLVEIENPTLREVVRDFMINRRFRQDVFVKGTIPILQHKLNEVWLGLRFALSTPRTGVPITVTTYQLEYTLEPERYEPILDAFAKGPCTVWQLLEVQRVAELGWKSLREALIVLVGAGHLQPCLGASGDSERAERTKTFNSMVIERAQSSSELSFLASPKVGGGIEVDRISQLFLLGRERKDPDVPRFVWTVLAKFGQRLARNGETLESDEENLAELREQYDKFTNDRFLLLEQLGIA